MNTLKRSSAVLTGIFVVAAIAILTGGVFAIGGQDKTFSKSVAVKAFFEDVSGLAKGNNVWYAGVKIGTVKSMAFAGSGVEVQFTVTEAAQQHIHTDTKAKLGTDGLIGNKIIVLYGGSAGAPVVAAGNSLRVEKAVSTETMMNTLQENNKNLLAITNNFKSISKGLAEGTGTIGKLLTDERLMNSLQATMHTLNKASANTEVLTSNLSHFSGQLNKKGSLVNNLISDTTVFAVLRETSVQLNKASITTNEVVANLATTTKSLNTTDGSVGMLLNDKETAGRIKNMVHNLEAGTQKLDANMEALQHNFCCGDSLKESKSGKENGSPGKWYHASLSNALK